MFTCNYIEECKNQTFAEKCRTPALLALTANSCCSTPRERRLPQPSCGTAVCKCFVCFWMMFCFAPVCLHSSVQCCILVGSLEESQKSERRSLPRICASWGFGGHQRKYPQLQWRRGWGTRPSKDHCVMLQLRGDWWLTVITKMYFMLFLYNWGP